MRSSLAVLLAFVAVGASAVAACTSSDPPAQFPAADASGADVSLSDGAPPSADDSATPPSEAGVDGGSDGGATDGPADDGKDFCETAAGLAAAFCADFEKSTNVGDGWDEYSTNGTATLTLDTSIAQQKKSALAKVDTGGSGAANFVTVVDGNGTKSRVVLEFDGYLDFPNGPPSTNSLFLTMALRTGSGPTGHYFIDLERTTTGWQILRTGASGEPFLGFGTSAWHHFRLSYDGSGGAGEIKFFVDGVNFVAISATKGPPPGGAPATFDNILIEHLGIDADKATSFYIDNVTVTYP